MFHGGHYLEKGCWAPVRLQLFHCKKCTYSRYFLRPQKVLTLLNSWMKFIYALRKMFCFLKKIFYTMFSFTFVYKKTNNQTQHGNFNFKNRFVELFPLFIQETYTMLIFVTQGVQKQTNIKHF